MSPTITSSFLTHGVAGTPTVAFSSVSSFYIQSLSLHLDTFLVRLALLKEACDAGIRNGIYVALGKSSEKCLETATKP